MKLLGIFLTLCVFQTNGFHKFHCNGHVGVLPDPANCQCFYICNFDEAVHECCNREELFDAKFLVCNHEYLVDCHERPEPGESTTRKICSCFWSLSNSLDVFNTRIWVSWLGVAGAVRPLHSTGGQYPWHTAPRAKLSFN